jgi:hypothetical protein
MVLKQVRPLEPFPRQLDAHWFELPFPYDIMRRVSAIERWECQTKPRSLDRPSPHPLFQDEVKVRITQAYTQEQGTIQFPYAHTPFVGEVQLSFQTQEQSNPYIARATHLNYVTQGVLGRSSLTDEESPNHQDNETSLRVESKEGHPLAFSNLTLTPTQLIWTSPRWFEGQTLDLDLDCESTLLFSSPILYLRRLLDQYERQENGD